MKRTFDLSRLESEEATALEIEFKDLLAKYGSATLDIENIKQQLPQARQKQDVFLKRLAQNRGVQNFFNCKIEGMQLVLEVPEEIQAKQLEKAQAKRLEDIEYGSNNSTTRSQS